MEALGADDSARRPQRQRPAGRPAHRRLRRRLRRPDHHRTRLGGQRRARSPSSSPRRPPCRPAQRCSGPRPSPAARLIPCLRTLGEIWHHASSWWISLGAGLPGHGDPFGYVLWILGVLGGGDANGAMVWLLLLAMPLSGLARLVRRRRPDAPPPVPPRGRPGLGRRTGPAGGPQPGPRRSPGGPPHDAAAGPGPAARHRLRSRPRPVCRARPRASGASPRSRRPKPGINGTPSWTAAAAAGLALAVVTAAAPSLLMPAAVVVVLCGTAAGPPRPHRLVGAAAQRRAVRSVRALRPRPAAGAARRSRRAAGIRRRPALAAAPGPAAALRPRRRAVTACRSSAAGPGARGHSCWRCWSALPVLLLAVAALFLPGRRARTARALWAAALLVLAGGWLAGHVATGASADALVTPFTGPAVPPPASPSWARP